MKPCPETSDCEKLETVAKLIVAPPNPANNPETTTAKYLYKYILTFNVSAAFGCSPTAISLNPNLVLYKYIDINTTKAIAT